MCPTELEVEDGLVEEVVTVTAELVRAWKPEVNKVCGWTGPLGELGVADRLGQELATGRHCG